MSSPLFHMFYLAFVVSNMLFVTRENFEDHFIKFGRLQFVEVKLSTAEYKWIGKYKSVNPWIKTWIVKYKNVNPLI